jgi:DNA replication protein DnaC
LAIERNQSLRLPPIATAIVDRLVENSEIFLLGGDSLRKAKNPSTPPTE